MTRQRIRLVLAWVASLIVVAFIVQARAQVGSAQPEDPRAIVPVPPTVLSGNDIGFRVNAKRGAGTAIGELVVRINGQWVAAKIGSAEYR